MSSSQELRFVATLFRLDIDNGFLFPLIAVHRNTKTEAIAELKKVVEQHFPDHPWDEIEYAETGKGWDYCHSLFYTCMSSVTHW